MQYKINYINLLKNSTIAAKFKLNYMQHVFKLTKV